MTVGYYVYYRVAPDKSVQARHIVASLQEDVRRRTAVPGRLLQRRDDPTTWMEIYEGISDAQGFEAELDAAVARCGLSSLLAGGSQRITEVFVSV